MQNIVADGNLKQLGYHLFSLSQIHVEAKEAVGKNNCFYTIQKAIAEECLLKIKILFTEFGIYFSNKAFIFQNQWSDK